MKLKVEINKIKSIEHTEIELPIEKGLYAITGQNGSGKSTLVTCASSVFFNMQMKDYFGKTDNDAYIKFDLNGIKRSYTKNSYGKWSRYTSGHLKIKGFYEGSLIYGNRFRNTNYSTLRKLDYINENLLEPAPNYILENLGYILHNNKNFYDKLYIAKSHRLRNNNIKIYSDIFYYKKGEKRISQFHMSTGENLLISILNSLNIRNSDRATLDIPCLLLLDEIELALHPSSLKRLVEFMKKTSEQYNYAVYFSTHSIEIISSIKPDNIFFLHRHLDDSLEIINPTYPAYATRILYDHTGYDYIILVEDDLAKEIISRLLRKYSLLGNKLVHVLPAGGYTNVIDLGQEVVTSNLVGKVSSILIILDQDIKESAQQYIAKNNISNNIPLNYLPIESLEKYIKSNLYDKVDHNLFRFLNDFIFHQKSLTEILEEYKNNDHFKNDNNGKKLYSLIDKELRNRNKTRIEFVDLIVDYLIKNETENLKKVVNFLKKQLTTSG